MIKGEVIDKDATDYAADAQKIVERIVAENAKVLTDEQARAKLVEFKQQLDALPAEEMPAKFAELAQAHSACPSGRKGGDLGEFTHGQMVPEFDKVAFEQEVGTVSEPVKTQFGYHLVLTTKKTPAVEAKDDQPAAPEKVQASHILIKTGEAQKVPELNEVVDFLKRNNNRQAMGDFALACIRAANVEATGEFKQLLPPPEEPKAPAAAPAEAPETPVETAE
ncbi:MAG: peptidylprolyl isomerase [Kiritimatiellae bacterium]|nr:peptidylprolyl isomerase [Kiritimatiellia bacterium]